MTNKKEDIKGTADIQPPETKGQTPPPKTEVMRLDVTLVRVGLNAYDVLEGGLPLVCECGRPVQAALHNKSVEKPLKPCGLVRIVK